MTNIQDQYLVTKRNDIIENLGTYFTYYTSMQESRVLKDFNRAFRCSHNFVIAKINGKYVASNSKFIGYVDNDIETYVLERHQRHGSKTNRVISKLLGKSVSEGSEHKKLQKIYDDLVAEYGLDKSKVKTKFWYLGEISGELDEPTSEDDEFERQRRLASVLSRTGQARFRAELLNRYNSKCVISGCNMLEVIEAAHIIFASKKGSDKVTNGLILRSDLHQLFDRGKLTIDPTTLCVFIEESAKKNYAEFDGIDLSRIIKIHDGYEKVIANLKKNYHATECSQ